MATHNESAHRKRESGLERVVQTQYRFALGVIALLVISGQALVQIGLEHQFDDARVISLAGQQRYLNRAITESAVSAAIAGDDSSRAQYIPEIREALRAFEVAHKALRFGSDSLGINGINSLDVQAQLDQVGVHFAEINESVDVLLLLLDTQSGIGVMQRSIQDLLAMMMEEQDHMGVLLDGIVVSYERQSTAAIRGISRFQWFLASIILLALLAVSLLAFQPLVLLVQKTMEELIVQREKAQDALHAKSSFLAIMSHEIRTPMNGVIGMTSLLEQTELDEEQQDYVATIRSSGDALLTIINDILDFSKIEAGKLVFEAVPIDVYRCIASCLDVIALKAEEKHIELGSEIEAHVPRRLVGDPTRIRQVIVNLLSNAVKFTAQGSVRIRVGGVHLDGGGFMLEIGIRDTGIGIPADKMDRLFQSFSQVDSSTTRKFGGTGLGLSISKRLVEQMGGSMGVESEAGAGSHFFFSILTRCPEGNASLLPTTPCSGRRVALAIGQRDRADLIERQLIHWQADVRRLAIGPELVDAAGSFDVLILDLAEYSHAPTTLMDALEGVLAEQHVPVLGVAELGGVYRIPIVEFDGYSRVNRPVHPASLLEKLEAAAAWRTRACSAIQCVVIASRNRSMQRLLARICETRGIESTLVVSLEGLHEAGNTRIVLIDRPLAMEITRVRWSLQDHSVEPSVTSRFVGLCTDAEDEAAFRAAGIHQVVHQPFGMEAIDRVLRQSVAGESEWFAAR